MITTQGIILRSIDRGESDVLLSILTKDFGQIFAKATGVRSEKSKNRFSLQEYSLSNISLVQGKGGWRITSTSHIKSFYFDHTDEIKRNTILKIISLVRRMYVGEEANHNVFEHLLSSLNEITLAEGESGVEDVEIKTLFHFLNNLGYVENVNAIDTDNKYELRKIINQGIRESGL